MISLQGMADNCLFGVSIDYIVVFVFFVRVVFIFFAKGEWIISSGYMHLTKLVPYNLI